MPQTFEHLHTGVWSFLDESQEQRITRLYMPKWVSYARANEALARMEHMLAYYVEWHMRERLKPMLFDDEYLDEASAARASPVAKAIRSEHAKAKDASKTADDGLPLHSFRTLLKDLGTLAYNITHTAVSPEIMIVTTTRPTPLQAKAFKLLGLNPACTQ